MGDKEGQPVGEDNVTSTICPACDQEVRKTLESMQGGPVAKKAEASYQMSKGPETVTDEQRSLPARGDLIGPKEAARILSVTQNTLRRWADRGAVKSLRINPRGDRRFVRSDVEKLADELRNNAGYLEP